MFIAMHESGNTMRQLPPVDDDIFEALQDLAEPLVDDVNSVLRRLLRLDDSPGPDDEAPQTVDDDVVRSDSSEGAQHGPSAKPKSSRRSKRTTKGKSVRRAPRAARGTLLPEAEYEIPLLRALENSGGSAPASEIIEDVGRALASQLTEADHEELKSGLTRWRNRVQFVRLKLVQAGEMKKDSPRGTWEIAPPGKQRLNGLSDNE